MLSTALGTGVTEGNRQGGPESTGRVNSETRYTAPTVAMAGMCPAAVAAQQRGHPRRRGHVSPAFQWEEGGAARRGGGGVEKAHQAEETEHDREVWQHRVIQSLAFPAWAGQAGVLDN